MDYPKPQMISRLAEAAKEARRNAHAPYSNFQVGAALLDQEGRIFAGCNVENASYGLSICAERHAIGAAVAGGALGVEAMVILSESSPPASPCGACRQVMAEFGDFPVLLINPEGEEVRSSVAKLLPMAFTFEDGKS